MKRIKIEELTQVEELNTEALQQHKGGLVRRVGTKRSKSPRASLSGKIGLSLFKPWKPPQFEECCN